MLENKVLLDYFGSQALKINLGTFVLDMIVAAVLAFILSIIYIYFSSAVANRKSFSANFVLLTLTTFLVISVIKSSLALSLGLVGALSIVRFRTPIKDPEELVYIFLCVALGLGFGAEQRYITTVAFAFIIVILISYGLIKKRDVTTSNLFISIVTHPLKDDDLENLIQNLKSVCKVVSLKRLDQNKDRTELLLNTQALSVKSLSTLKNMLHRYDENMELAFFEDKGLIS